MKKKNIKYKSEMESILVNLGPRSSCMERMSRDLLLVQEFFNTSIEISGIFEYHVLHALSGKQTSIFSDIDMISRPFLSEMIIRYMRNLSKNQTIDRFQIFFSLVMNSSIQLHRHPQVMNYIYDKGLPIVFVLVNEMSLKGLQSAELLIIESFLGYYLSFVINGKKTLALCRAISAIKPNFNSRFVNLLYQYSTKIFEANSDSINFGKKLEIEESPYEMVKMKMLPIELWIMLQKKAVDLDFGDLKKFFKQIKNVDLNMISNPIDRLFVKLNLKIKKIGFGLDKSQSDPLLYFKKIYKMLQSSLALILEVLSNLKWVLKDGQIINEHIRLSARTQNEVSPDCDPSMLIVQTAQTDAVFGILIIVQRFIYLNQLFKTKIDLRLMLNLSMIILKAFGAHPLQHVSVFLEFLKFVADSPGFRESQNSLLFIFKNQFLEDEKIFGGNFSLLLSIQKIQVARRFHLWQSCLIRSENIRIIDGESVCHSGGYSIQTPKRQGKHLRPFLSGAGHGNFA
jgi:hypothetical protein